ncbi:MAG: tagaturonate epimerase family protein [Anaerolineae bacterium]|jgi:hypothetical protein|nr:tagaturonate epimerase family protein [Anaerolineae bacterium]
MKVDSLPGLEIYPHSVTEADGITYFLARGPEGKVLGVAGTSRGFTGTSRAGVLICPLTSENAAVLRERLPWLKPQPLGLSLSAGCGDRLGLATPGHIRALRAVGGIAPVLAQQSIRENARTGRTPQQVLDDAAWGVFQEGWREPWGADADHLKRVEDVELCVAAGYTFYTLDPGDHVDNAAHTDALAVLRDKLALLPWDRLEDTPADLQARYLGREFTAGSMSLSFDEETLLRAACKYGNALAHVALLSRRLQQLMEGRAFDLEVSVDETETPTSAEEHFYISGELQRLGVHWVSLAPRFVGRFEKGVDYIGDLAAFETEVRRHVDVMRHFGGYKLSLHSGSDKFSIYPIVARYAGDLVHLKTAGTSYLEGLRAVAGVAPVLFRKILALAFDRYPVERASYHVSADPESAPSPERLEDVELPVLLDQFDIRQMLHVTYGSALEHYGEDLMRVLDRNEEAYYAALEAHFTRHFAPFRQPGA